MTANLRLIDPAESFKKKYLDMIFEWKEASEELIPWSLSLDTSDFNLMIESLDGYRKGMNLPEGFVESSTYWLINEQDEILGAIDIRHRLNDFLSFRGGHVGYGIRPKHRRKGYASVMLFLGLEKCKDIGISKVLITCLKENTGSSKVIVKNGGVLESEDIDDGKIFQRYWIDLK